MSALNVERDNLQRVIKESNKRRMRLALKYGLNPDASWEAIDKEWVKLNPNNKRTIDPETKEKVIASCRAGESVTCLALKYSISPKTIYGWLRSENG